MACPFSPDRLRELFVVREWRPDQIAELAGAATGELPAEGEVETWLREAGIDPDPQKPRVPLPVTPRPGAVWSGQGVKPPVKRYVPPRKRETRECEYCGEPVTRRPCEFKAHVYCSPECSKAARAAGARLRRAERKVQAARQQGVKLCAECGLEKPVEEFSVDVSRIGGRGRTCKECNRAKSRRYYLANQERLKTRARERKHR